MRFYHPATADVVTVHNPRSRLFLLGPLYLASLRLWKDAVLLTAAVVLPIWAAMAATRSAVGPAAEGGFPEIWAAFQGIMVAMGDQDASVDAAYAAFVALSLPYYAAAVVLLIISAAIALWAPAYFRWRYTGLGYVMLDTGDLSEQEQLQEM